MDERVTFEDFRRAKAEGEIKPLGDLSAEWLQERLRSDGFDVTVTFEGDEHEPAGDWHGWHGTEPCDCP